MEPAEILKTHIPRRGPAQVMRLKRLGSFHPSRLSFMRILMRRMKQERWTFTRPIFKIDTQGVGHAVYTAQGPECTYSLIAFAHDLPEDQRSDRVIAEAWDTTFTLFDGVPSDKDIKRLSENVPLQEAGRISEKELSLSRANRSVRLWTHVVEALADGHQPDPEKIASVGYLMRTTAVYGSGKFGAADREKTATRPEFTAPFQIEMLSVYLIRWFVRDLAQHMAHIKGGQGTATLNPAIARSLGIGNSTGLGMAPFIVNHPILFNNWIMVREEALARVRSVKTAQIDKIKIFKDIFQRGMRSIALWVSDHPIQIEKLKILKADLGKFSEYFQKFDMSTLYPWNALYLWAEERLSEEAQEYLASLMLEPYSTLVDGLAECMASNNDGTFIDGSMKLLELGQLLETHYDWALKIDWTAQENTARAWYISQEKLEPRLGERFQEPIAEYEQPLAPGRDANALYQALKDWPEHTSVAEFLLAHPEYRHSMRRVQTAQKFPYAEIHDNTISATMQPIDMLRCKLSFFGAMHFNPRSDRWVQICMYANAPYPDELVDCDAEFWPYPV